jgi:ankyrin repeat protein
MKSSPQLKQAAEAAARGDCRALRKILNASPEITEDARLLNDAALHGQIEAVRLLISSGSDPDGQVPSHEYYRPLHRAIEHRGVPRNPGHRQVVETLIEAGASLEERATWMQLVPLAVAGMVGDREVIELLHEAGSVETIFTAAITVDYAGVRRFLKRKSAALTKDVNNMTPLHYAALCGVDDAERGKIAEMLLDAGADPDARENIGPYPETPVLHFAAWKNYPLAEVLLSRGANPNFGFGNCLWREPGEMAELFLAHGADVNGREASGQPFLNSRIHWNLTSVALWLLKNGANPNLTDSAGNTALHEAAWRGVNPKVVEAILAKGGKRSAKNKDGVTPLDIAKQKNRGKIVPLLAK